MTARATPPSRLLRRLRRWWVGPTKDEMLRDTIAADQGRIAEVRSYLCCAPSGDPRPCPLHDGNAPLPQSGDPS